MSIAFFDSAARAATSQTGAFISQPSGGVSVRKFSVPLLAELLSNLLLVCIVLQLFRMCGFAALTCLALVFCLSGFGAEAVELVRANEELRRIQALVDAGALPASSLKKAQEDVEDAQDEAHLRETLFGHFSIENLTEHQAEEMVSTARRRLERQKARIERTKDLINQGALPNTALAPLEEEYQYRSTVLELAVSRCRLLLELAAMARAEQRENAWENHVNLSRVSMERFDGSGFFSLTSLEKIARMFLEHFGKPLPISARGQTAVHRALGLDHRGKVDVAVDPDKPEGVWLRHLLEESRIPYYAFRSFIPGKSTAPHIHIGPPSARLRPGG